MSEEGVIKWGSMNGTHLCMRCRRSQLSPPSRRKSNRTFDTCNGTITSTLTRPASLNSTEGSKSPRISRASLPRPAPPRRTLPELCTRVRFQMLFLIQPGRLIATRLQDCTAIETQKLLPRNLGKMTQVKLVKPPKPARKDETCRRSSKEVKEMRSTASFRCRQGGWQRSM